MSPNQIVVRNLVGVVLAITLVTIIGLVLGGASRRAAAVPAPVVLQPSSRDPVALGHRLYETKGCIQCHTIDGSPKIGPSFKGSWGTDVALAGGVTLRFDAAYVRESLAHPQSQARPGYPPSMPSFDGLLREREIDALIAFLESLRQPSSTL
jgi:cytochrome c2